MEGNEIVSLRRAMEKNLVFDLNLFKILKKFKSVSKFSVYIPYVRTKSVFVRVFTEFRKMFELREEKMTDKLLRLPKVLELVGIKKTKLWEMIKKGKFPRQRKLGTKTSVWSFIKIQQLGKEE